MKTPKYIFVHHTAVSYDKNPDQWKATDNYHRAKGWGGGGYNYEISKVGSVHQFRKDGSITAAQYQQSMNDGRALSIALDGNFDIELPTDKQCKSLFDLIKEKQEKYNILRNNIHPHRYVANYKSCWGKLVPDNILEYLESRLSVNSIPEWATESVEKAKLKGITNWERPWEEVTAQLVEFIFNDLGFREKMRGTISKVELIVVLDKAGLLD